MLRVCECTHDVLLYNARRDWTCLRADKTHNEAQLRLLTPLYAALYRACTYPYRTHKHKDRRMLRAHTHATHSSLTSAQYRETLAGPPPHGRGPRDLTMVIHTALTRVRRPCCRSAALKTGFYSLRRRRAPRPRPFALRRATAMPERSARAIRQNWPGFRRRSYDPPPTSEGGGNVTRGS